MAVESLGNTSQTRAIPSTCSSVIIAGRRRTGRKADNARCSPQRAPLDLAGVGGCGLRPERSEGGHIGCRLKA
jgi:hypothetical protein